MRERVCRRRVAPAMGVIVVAAVACVVVAAAATADAAVVAVRTRAAAAAAGGAPPPPSLSRSQTPCVRVIIPNDARRCGSPPVT